MTHYWALVVFLAVLAVMAAASDADQRRRARYAALDENADLCRGQQVDRTPEMRAAPVHPAKNATEAINQITHQQENQ
ncbi:hypothetical protein FK529_04635 [Tsukamurella asaccharolytica]|uniref:Uncharacterized protein n=1 Tax=Tsukamurella asaccharolytica TaxID=2592067 RepID=A0A5C5RDY3_9ACTN|nr:hypothetical protein [Tsukamurella asaccharolytica]TWS20633.1 hypothetical protein FK529_04635 [Tsukamurella asaccharolytica]